METIIKNQYGVLCHDPLQNPLWNIQTVYINQEESDIHDEILDYKDVIQLQWGDGANLTENGLEFIKRANGGECDFNSVTTSIEGAKMLYKKLGSLLREQGFIHDSRQLLKENEELRNVINELAIWRENPPAFQAVLDSVGYI